MASPQTILRKRPRGVHVSIPSAAAAPSTDIMASPQTVLTKRPRGVGDAIEKIDEEIHDSHRTRPNKKGKTNGATTTGALEEAGSTESDQRSKVVRRGAERLVTQNAQGVSDRSLQDPNVRQVSTGIIAQEQPPWIAGSVEEQMWYPIDITVTEEGGLLCGGQQARGGAERPLPHPKKTRPEAQGSSRSHRRRLGTRDNPPA